MNADNCYYVGELRIGSKNRLLTPKQPFVAAELCNPNGVSASFIRNNEWYGIEPALGLLSETEINDFIGLTKDSVTADSKFVHILFRTEDIKHRTDFCGHKESSDDNDDHNHNNDMNNRQHSSSRRQSSFRKLSSAQLLADELSIQSRSASTSLPETRSSSRFTTQSVNFTNPIQYIELLVVNDNARFRQMVDSTESEALTIVNQAAALYVNNLGLDPPIRVVLVGQITWRHSDPYNLCFGYKGCGLSTVCPNCEDHEIGTSQLLSTFHAWRSNPANTEGIYHDAGVLFSGLDFEYSLIGLAGVGMMCNYPKSGAIVQTYQHSSALSAFSLTHELGHSIGMIHDSDTRNECSAYGNIMTTTITVPFVGGPTLFSECSIRQYTDWVHNLTASQLAAVNSGFAGHNCIENKPIFTYGTLSSAVCGNGYIEATETCDCGSTNCAGIDNCCNGATCQLLTGKQCSALAPCCDPNTCTIISANSPQQTVANGAIICRYGDARSECDANTICFNSSRGECGVKMFAPKDKSCSIGQCNSYGQCLGPSSHTIHTHSTSTLSLIISILISVAVMFSARRSLSNY